MPSFTEETLGKDKWWIILNSPGTFLGTTPRGDTRNSVKGGDSNGPTKRRASVSFLILEKTTSGWSRALNRFSASKERNSPSKCRGNPLVNPAYKNSTVDGVYPTRKFLRRSAFIGVGRLWLCLGWG